MFNKFLATMSAALLLPGMALAHPGHDEISGFSHGLLHPMTGADHLLAMIAVGLIAGIWGGRMIWAMPLAFVGAMLGGAFAGLAGLALPGVELWILGSIIVMGIAVFLPTELVPQSALLVGAAVFGLFHGYARGAEAPLGGSLAGYLAGFPLTPMGLHAIGILNGQKLPALVVRGVGLAIALTGIGLASFG